MLSDSSPDRVHRHHRRYVTQFTRHDPANATGLGPQRRTRSRRAGAMTGRQCGPWRERRRHAASLVGPGRGDRGRHRLAHPALHWVRPRASPWTGAARARGVEACAQPERAMSDQGREQPCDRFGTGARRHEPGDAPAGRGQHACEGTGRWAGWRVCPKAGIGEGRSIPRRRAAAAMAGQQLGAVKSGRCTRERARSA